jgi:hypothetical protein
MAIAERATLIGPARLRSFDAIHIASALAVAPDLETIVTTGVASAPGSHAIPSATACLQTAPSAPIRRVHLATTSPRREEQPGPVVGAAMQWRFDAVARAGGTDPAHATVRRVLAAAVEDQRPGEFLKAVRGQSLTQRWHDERVGNRRLAGRA